MSIHAAVVFYIGLDILPRMRVLQDRSFESIYVRSNTYQ